MKAEVQRSTPEGAEWLKLAWGESKSWQKVGVWTGQVGRMK